MVKPVLYAHPFSSYSQKVFIAFYEKKAPFELRTLSPDNPSAATELASLWPLKKFPVLKAGDLTLMESSIIIEWLDGQAAEGERLIPAEPARALEVRMLDRICDNYVMEPMMRLVADRLRPEPDRDPHGVAQAHALLDRSCAWLDERMTSREWAAGSFSLADCAAAPALFYADWVHPLAAHRALHAYLRRLRERPSFARCVEDARPARNLFPGGPPTHID